MLPASRERILRDVPEDARVLDVGGWASPFARADWVIDHMPHSTRGVYGHDPGRERFSEATWLVHDICSREPFPFEDKSFDFVVCSQTLEDIRDPVWVCSEMERIGRAGYIEVPSRLQEQSLGVQGDWAGWAHHHWLIETGPRSIEFVLKFHVIHSRRSDHFPFGFAATLTEEEQNAQLWWEGSFDYRERYLQDSAETDEYLQSFVARELAARGFRRRDRWRRWRTVGAGRRLG